MKEEFTAKERKKEFNKIFKEKIVPFFRAYGFDTHTKTSKRLFKNLEEKLSVFIFIEYKNRFDVYDMTIAYFDEEYGNVYDDNYLVMVSSKNGMHPNFRGNTTEELNLSIDRWLIEIKTKVFPFIEKHSTYKSILESNQFYISKARKDEIMSLLKRKSK